MASSEVDNFLIISASFAMKPSDRSPVPAEKAVPASSIFIPELIDYMPILKYSLCSAAETHSCAPFLRHRRLQWFAMT